MTTETWRSLKMGLPLIWARHTYSPRSSLFTFSKCSALSESCRTRSPSEVRQSIKALTRWNTHWNTTTLILCYCKGGLRSIWLWVCSGCISAYFSTKPVKQFTRPQRCNIMNLMLKVHVTLRYITNNWMPQLCILYKHTYHYQTNLYLNLNLNLKPVSNPIYNGPVKLQRPSGQHFLRGLIQQSPNNSCLTI